MRPEACAAAREALPVESETRAAPTPDATVREGEMEGALHVVGEVGYRAASVRAVLEYSGGHRKQFYDHFENLEACFAQAYETWIDRLGVSLLEAAVSASGWRAAVQAGLVRLFEFVAEQPAIARALFLEVQVAGGAAMAKHEEATERLAAALDSVRAEIETAEEPPEATGFFVVGGIEAGICEVLAEGNPNRVWDALPELMHLAVGSYLGPAAAEEAFEAAKQLLERERARLAGEGEGR
jgi:AcrR family transcriptional regulator